MSGHAGTFDLSPDRFWSYFVPTSRLSADTSSFLARGNRAKRTCESLPRSRRAQSHKRAAEAHPDFLRHVCRCACRPRTCFHADSEAQIRSSDVGTFNRIASQPFVSSPPEAHFSTAPSRSTKSSQGEIMNLATRTVVLLCYSILFFTFRVGDKKKSNTKQGSDLTSSSFVRGSRSPTCPSFLPSAKNGPGPSLSGGKRWVLFFFFSRVIIVLEMKLAAAECARNVFYGRSLTGWSLVRHWGCVVSGDN